MAFPKSVITALEAIFERAGAQLKNTEFLGDQLAKQVTDLPVKGTFLLVGYAVNAKGTKHKVVKDNNDDHHLVDNDNRLHKL